MNALKDNLLCYNPGDYKAVWNSIAVCALAKGISIYCICLMSNHFHILLSGTQDQIDAFFQLLKRKTGRYLKSRYPRKTLPRLEYELFPVPDRKAFCREVAYILRNPYKAGFSHPLSYHWSSAAVYFPSWTMAGCPITDYTYREKRSLLQTRLRLPETLLISDGAISPVSFIDRAFVERMFDNSPVQYFNMLKSWNLEDIVKASHGEEVADSYSDEEVVQGIREICRDVFRIPSPEQLDRKSLARLSRRIHSRYGCTRKQLMRLLPVDETFLDRTL